MIKISSLKKLVTDSMAIDLGTASTIIAVRERGIVVDEPTLVAINELTEEVVAFGQEASDMSGREGRDIVVTAPMIGGVEASDGTWLEADERIDGGPSVVYDAEVVADFRTTGLTPREPGPMGLFRLRKAVFVNFRGAHYFRRFTQKPLDAPRGSHGI